MPIAPASGFASPATGPATGPDPAALPGDWQKLGFDSDPLPGNPRVLQQIVEDFTFLRDTAWTVHQGLDAFLATAGPDAFEGQTADALREVVSGRLKTFTFTIAQAFSLAGEAVAEYRLALESAQQAVRGLVAQAVGLAAGDRELAGLARQVTEQVARVRDAEALMIRTLQDASAMVSQPIAVPSLFEKIWKGVEEALSIAGMVLALLSVVVDGPLGIMAAAAAGASLAMTAVDYARGETNALGVVLAVVGLLAPTTKGLFTLEEAGAGLRGFLGTLGQAGAKTSSVLASPAHLAALVARTGAGTWQALTRAPGLLAQAVRAAPGVLARLPQALGGLGEALGRDFATVHKWYPQLSRALSPQGAYVLVTLGRFGGALLSPMTVEDLAALGFRGAWRAGVQRASWSNAARALHRGWTSYGIRATHAAWDVGQMLHLLGGLRPQPDTGHLPTLLLPGPVRWPHRGPDDLAEPLLTPVTPWTAHDPAHTTPPSVPTTRTALDIAEYNGRAGLLTTRTGLLVPVTSLLNDQATRLLRQLPTTDRAVTTRADPMRQTAPRSHTHLVDPNDPATTGQVQEVYATEATDPDLEAWWSLQDLLPLSPWHTTLPTVFDAGWTPQADDAAQHLPHAAGPLGAPDAEPHATPPSYAHERPALDPGEHRPAKQARWTPAHTADQPGPSNVPEYPTPWPVTHAQSTLADMPGFSGSLHPNLPHGWLENLRGDLVRKNHRSGLGRLTNALRTLIQTEYLTPGTHLPGRELARHLANPDILPGTVSNAYMQLRNEGLVVAGQGRGTRVAGPGKFPAFVLPADWLERLKRELEGDRWFEQVLRTHLLNLPPHTLLPSHEKLAELLDLPETSDILLKNAYSRLAEGGLLVRDSHNDMRVADHNGPVHPATAPQTSQTAGATRPTTNDSHPLLPITWVRDLRSELENNPFNPSSGRDKMDWFTQALRTHITTLPPRTHLPSFRDLADRLENVGITHILAHGAYNQLKAEDLLIRAGYRGTWVVGPEDLMRPVTEQQASQTAGVALPDVSNPKHGLSDDWIETFRRDLENNPHLVGDKATWLVRALERNIQSLNSRTRLPSHQYLAEILKSAGISGINNSLVRLAYARLKETGQLTSEFGKGTWAAKTRDAMDPATGPGLPQARTEQDEPPLPTDPLLGTPELDEAQFREMWEFWNSLDDEEYGSGSGSGTGHLDGPEPMDSSAYPRLSPDQFTTAEHAPGPRPETHCADPNSPAAIGQVQEVYATEATGPDAEAGWSPQDLPLSPEHITSPTVLDDAERIPQAGGAAQHRPYTAGPAGAPGAEPHATPPSSYAREHPALDPGEPQPTEQTRWAPAQTADQPGPSSTPGHPDPWPLTHTGLALTGTSGTSGSLHHYLPPDWLENVRHDLICKNYHTGPSRLANTLRTLIQTNYLKQGTYLPEARDLTWQLANPDFLPKTVLNAYVQLRDENLLITGPAGTWVAGSAESPAPVLPADWLERLQHEMEDGRWFEHVLRTHLLNLPPHTPLPPLPPRGELAGLLGILGIPDTLVHSAYGRLAEDGLLVRDSHNDMRVADHNGPVHPATASRTSQTAGATRPTTNDTHPLPPINWVRELISELENNPRSDCRKITWFTRALETHIQSLEYRTRLPSIPQLAKQLKSTGINDSLVQRAYARLKKTGQLTSEFGEGTWVSQPRNVVDPATAPGLPQARIEHGEPPLPTNPLPEIPELDETQHWEMWDTVDGEDYGSGPSNAPEYPAPWPLTHTQPAFADTPSPSDSLHHHLPSGWLENLRGDLVRKNHRSGLGRLTNALRTLIQTEYLTPGTHLPGRKLARHLANPDILPKTVSNAYMQLRHQGLAIAGQGRGTRVAGPAESPASALPADWLERLQHEMEGDRWFEQVLRTHLLNLPPHTLLPPHEKLAELLDLPETSDILLKNAYSRLAEGGLLVRGSNDTRVADHNGPVHPVTAPQTSQTAGATRPTTNDSHPLLPITWVRDLRSELENNPFNPSSGREKATWFAQALERNIQSLEHRTRLPSFVQLAEQLKGAGVNTSLVQRAYTHLKEIGQLTAEFGKGTWVAKTRDAMDPATGPGLPQARTEQDEPPLPTDPLLDIPELDETQLQELWETLEAEEPRATPPVMPGTRLDPHADRAAQATAHLTDPSHLPHLPHPDVHDILSLLSRTGRPRPHALNPGRPMTGTWNQGAAEQ